MIKLLPRTMRMVVRGLVNIAWIVSIIWALAFLKAVLPRDVDASIVPPVGGDDARSTPRPVRSKPAATSWNADVNGQFRIEGKANGVALRFLVDTGATGIVLRISDAQRLGFNVNRLAFDGRSSTANGIVRTATVRITRLTVGPFTSLDVPVSIDDSELDEPLLGMAFLRGVNVSISNGKLTLSGG